MESAENRLSNELAEPLDRPTIWRIPVQGQMCSAFIAIGGVSRNDPAQVGLADDNSMIEAIAADRTDQSLRMPVLPGCPRGDRMIPYSHRRKTPGDSVTVRRLTIPDHVGWRFVLRKGIRDLMGDPFRRGMGRYTQRYQPPPLIPEDDQNEKQSKVGCRHDQEVHGADAGRMIAEESFQGLRPPSPTPRHVLGDCRLGDSIPSLSSSPWIRGAPHNRLDMLISRFKRRISPGIFGRPRRERDFQRQYSRKPVRCHRMMVSG
jgi:hypothetical protein